MSAVVCIRECLRTSWTNFIGAPAARRNVAVECRRSCLCRRRHNHDARHSCATLALDAGVHPKVVQQLLGHASWSTTMDLYSHRIDRLQREATQRIECLLLPPEQLEDGAA